MFLTLQLDILNSKVTTLLNVSSFGGKVSGGDNILEMLTIIVFQSSLGQPLLIISGASLTLIMAFFKWAIVSLFFLYFRFCNSKYTF